jgi:hypothetical protein
MHSKLLLSVLFILLTSSSFLFAQVGINTDTPDDSSILDITAQNQGVLLPRMDLGVLTTASPVTAPAVGLIVWNTDLANAGSARGFYFWSGSRWEKIANSSEINNSGGGGTGTGWALNGNSVVAANFLGSTNFQSLNFRVNNTRVATFNPQSGAVSLGFNSAANNNRGVAIGNGSNAGSNDALSLGTSSSAGQNGVALGLNTNASGQSSVSLGNGASSTSQNATALGSASTASGQNSTAIGFQSSATQANSVILGKFDDNNSRVGIGTLAPTEKLQVSGRIRMVDGNQGAGKVLTSDANGVGTWQNLNDVKYFAETTKSNASNLTQFSYVPFGSSIISNNVTVNGNNFQTGNVSGVYRIKYKITVINNGSVAYPVGFFIATAQSSGNKLAGSESFQTVAAGEKATLSGERFVSLTSFQQIGVFSDSSSSIISVSAEGTSMNIELIKEL